MKTKEKEKKHRGPKKRSSSCRIRKEGVTMLFRKQGRSTKADVVEVYYSKMGDAVLVLFPTIGSPPCHA
jgi:hypothetical protein